VSASESLSPTSIKDGIETVRAIMEGIFIKGEINKQNVKLLVDTGASICLLSPKVYARIPVEVRPILNPVLSKRVVTADGNDMKIHGVADFEINVNDQNIVQCMCVANMELDAILGLDFMSGCKAVLDIGK
jgi:predicted aspartyl protease